MASSETRREKVDGGQGTDSNEHSRRIHVSVADSEVSKYEWQNRLSMGYDNGDDVETSKREALAESGRWARVEALHAIPRLVLVADPDAANVCEKKTWMERLELVEQCLSKLRAQPWLTVVECFCSVYVASVHPAQPVWSEGAC